MNPSPRYYLIRCPSSICVRCCDYRMKCHAAVVVLTLHLQFTTAPCIRQASDVVFSPPPDIQQISWCICSWGAPRRRCIGLIAARPAFASWMIESWPSGVSVPQRQEQERMCPYHAGVDFCLFFNFTIGHGELELKLNTDRQLSMFFMDIYRCIQTRYTTGE